MRDGGRGRPPLVSMCCLTKLMLCSFSEQLCFKRGNLPKKGNMLPGYVEFQWKLTSIKSSLMRQMPQISKYAEGDGGGGRGWKMSMENYKLA